MIHTAVQIMSTPAQSGNLPSDRAVSTEAPEMLLIAFQPVVDTMENTTTRRLPQYPKEYRLHISAFFKHQRKDTYENVVIRKPVSPNDAVQAGSRQEKAFTTRMIAKQSQKFMPMLPPTIPVDRVATAILALNLEEVSSSKNGSLIS